MKILYAATKGFKGYRNSIYGNYFVYVLVHVFGKYAHKHHLDDLIKLIGERLESHCKSCSNGEDESYNQINTEDIGFNQHLFFNPGYSEDNEKLLYNESYDSLNNIQPNKSILTSTGDHDPA